MPVPASAEAATSQAAASHRDVTIRINYSNTVNRLRPDPEDRLITNHSLTVVLSGLRNIEEKWNSRVGRSARRSSSVRVLGGGEWRVQGQNSLVRQIEYPQNWTIITVTVTDDKSCKATIDYVLKPGYREFTFPRFRSREIAYYSEAKTTSSTCQIE
jgi:hypothetical protein